MRSPTYMYSAYTMWHMHVLINIMLKYYSRSVYVTPVYNVMHDLALSYNENIVRWKSTCTSMLQSHGMHAQVNS